MQAMLVGELERRRETLLRGNLGVRVLLRIHDVHVPTAASAPEASAPMIESLRQLLDCGGFTDAASGSLCQIADATMIASGVTRHLPSHAEWTRFQRHLLTVSVTEPGASGTAVHGTFESTNVHRMCASLLESLASVLDNPDGLLSASVLTGFFVNTLQSCQDEVGGAFSALAFDAVVMRGILMRVHADLRLQPVDLCAEDSQIFILAAKLAGKDVLNQWKPLEKEAVLDDAESEVRACHTLLTLTHPGTCPTIGTLNMILTGR